MPIPHWIRHWRLSRSVRPRLSRRPPAVRLRPRFDDLESRVLLSVITWANPAGGDWDVPANWTPARLPGPTDDVLLPATGSAPVVHARGSDTMHSVTANRPFTLAGGTLTVVTVQATSTFTLAGGTLARALIAPGTTLTGSPAGGSLYQVTLDGSLTLASSSPASALVTGGLTLHGAVTLGDNAANAGVLHFDGPQTLAGTGTVQLGHDPRNTLWTTGGRLTLAPGITVHGQAGFIGYNPGLGNTPDASFVNQGTIQADGPTGTLTLLASAWANAGTLRAQPGSTLALTAPTGQSWSNTGTLAASAATLLLGSTGSGFSLDPASRFTTATASVLIAGTLDNTGRTLTLDPATTGSWQLAGGTVRGGTVATSGPARLLATRTPGNLAAVTLNGSLDATADHAALTVSGGLTLNGTLTLGDPTGTASLTFLGSQTLAGSGTVTLTGARPGNRLTTTNQATLTIGPGITVQGTGTLGYVAGASDYLYPSFAIQGTVAADSPGGSLTVNATAWTSTGNLQAAAATLNLQGTFHLAGRLTATANATVNLGEPGQTFTLAPTALDTAAGIVNLTGILDNTGRTLTLTPTTTGSWRLAASYPFRSGQILGGAVTAVGNARLVATPRGGFLTGVSLGADLDLASLDAAQLTVENGLTLNGTATLGNTTGSTHGSLIFSAGPQTLAGTGSIAFGPNPLNELDTRASRLTLGPALTVRGYSGAIDGAFTNLGTLAADRAGGTLTLRSPGWTNQGTVLAQNGGTLTALYPPTNFDGDTLRAGSWQVFPHSTLRLTDTRPATLAAAFTLDGTDAAFLRDPTATALDALTTVAPTGSLTVRNGLNVTTTAPFTNTGTLTVGQGSTFRTPLANLANGTLTGGTYLVQGTLQLDNADAIRTNNAAITLQGPTALVADATGGNALAPLQANGPAGQLAFLDGRNFTTAGSFTNQGTLTVGVGSAFFATTLTNYDPGSHTLSGGTFVVAGTLRFTGADLFTNAADLTLDGPAAQAIDQSSQDALAHLTTNAGSGTFTVRNGRNLTTGGMFLNNGTLAVGPNSTFYARSLANFVDHHLIGGTFLISGTLQFPGADVQTNDANTTLIGPSAAIVNEAGANALVGFNLNDYVGTFGTRNGSTFTPRADFRNLGAVIIGAGSTVTLHAGDQVGGGGALLVSAGATLLMAGTGGTGTIVNTLINQGQIIVQPGTTLDLGGGFGNYVGGVLAGGTYDLAGTLRFQGANVQRNRATLILDGPGSGVVNQSGGDGLVNFSANDAGGSLTLENGRTLTTAGDFSNDGTLTVAPGSSLTVNGTYAHTGTLTVQDQAAFNLAGSGTFSAGTFAGAGAARITGRLTWTGGRMVGPGSTTVAAGARLDISGGADKALDGRSLVNDGTVTWGGTGGILTGNGTDFRNEAGALFDAQGDAGLVFTGGTPASFTNAGTFRKSAGAGTTFVAPGWTFQNAGTLEVLVGTLNLSSTFRNFDGATQTLTGGTYRLQSRLQFAGADIRTNAAAITLDGPNAAVVDGNGGYALSDLRLNASGASITVANGRTLSLGGAANAPSNAGNLIVAPGGVLSLGADLTSTGTVSWTGGRLTGPGVLDVTAGGTLAVGGGDDKYLDPGAGVRVEGNATWTGMGAVRLAPGSTWTVMPGGTLDAQDNGSIRAAGTGGGLLVNQGTFLKSAGTGTTLVDAGVPFTNSGALKVLTGTLDLESGISNLNTGTHTLSGGTFDVVGTLKVAGADIWTNAADVTLDGPNAAVVNGAGADALAGLSLNDRAGSLTLRNGLTFRVAGALTNAGTVVLELGAGLSLGGTLTDTGRFNWTGGRVSGTGFLDVAAGGVLGISGSDDKYLAAGGGLTVEGTATWAGTGAWWLADGGRVAVQTGGTFEAQTDATLGLGGPGAASLLNQGTFRKSAGTGTTLVGAAVSFSNPGTVEVLTGTLDLEGPFDRFNAAAGTLSGGTYVLDGTLKFPGAAIRTNAATLVLDGIGSGVVDQTGRDALAGLSLNDTSGNLTVRNQRVLRTAGPFTNLGGMVVELNAGLGLAGTLTDSGSFTWSSGRLSGPGSLDVAVGGTLTLTGTDDKTLDAGAVLRVAGSATWAGTGALALGDGSGLIVLATGTLDAQDNGTVRAAGATTGVVNQGTFRKVAGGGTTTIGAGVSFTSAGTVAVLAGTLDLEGPFTNYDTTTHTLAGGTFALNAALRFPNARIATNAAAVVLGGTNAAIVDQAGNDALAFLTYNAPQGNLRISGRSLSFLNPVEDAGTITLAGGDLDLEEDFVVTGTFIWTGGNLTGIGAFTVDAAGVLAMSGPGDKGVENSGGLWVDGQTTLVGTGRLWVPKESGVTIMAGGMFDARDDGDVTGSTAGPLSGSILNQGVFRKSGSGMMRVESGVGFVNQGTVVVDGGVLDLEGAFPNFDARDQSLSGGAFVLRGVLKFSGAAVAINETALTLDGPAAALTDTAGNDALVYLTRNETGANLTMQNGAAVTVGGAFVNAGTVVVGQGSTFLTGADYTQDGVATVLAGGSLAARSVVIAGGVLSGAGTVYADVVNAGELDVGGVGLPGILNVVGDFTQTAAGVLSLKLGGTAPGSGYDQLNVSGNAHLDGTLDVAVLDGFFTHEGDGFRVLTFGARDGDFARADFAHLGHHLYLDPVFDDDGLTLVTRRHRRRVRDL